MPQPSLQLIWGCDPALQLERGWLHSLLASTPLQVVQSSEIRAVELSDGTPRVLVESGLLRLERQPSEERLRAQQQARVERLQRLEGAGPFTLVHLSDEEGFDGDELYPMLPQGTPIFRNFPYPRFPAALNFPIGPRTEFLVPGLEVAAASTRPLPWAFMGTLWASGSRFEATALFLHALPQGYFFGGRRFGQGLPITDYRDVLAQSVFALCPEGDRHLDTFRLYESLQMGCLPLIVDRAEQASALLGSDYPLPVFVSWAEALAYAQAQLQQPQILDHQQQRLAVWWDGRCRQVAQALLESCRP